MSLHVHFDYGSWEFTVALTLTLLLGASLYLGRWIHHRSASASGIPAWRAGSFFLGMFFVWTAVGSPLAAYDHSLLTFHMVKHLLLMTFAPLLILLGEPMRVFWDGMPLLALTSFGPVAHRAPLAPFPRI